jgi:hypothetical protein
MTNTTISHTNAKPDEPYDEATSFYETIPEPITDEELLLPAVFNAKIRKRDHIIAPHTYRRPQHLQYIEYS